MSEFTDYAQGTPCWVELSTGDLAGALDFYRAVFGWEYDEPMTDRDSYTIVRQRGKAVAGIFVPGLPNVPTVWGTYLAANDAEETMKAIAEHGGQAITGLMDLSSGGKIQIAADPTGGVFGVFQGMGAQLGNEPGTVIWNELLTTDTGAARAFYAAVFGLTISEPFDNAPDYTSIHLADGHEVGGIGALTEGGPAHWLTYFGAADADATAAAVRAAGGSVTTEPFDSPYGRIAFCADPAGATFALLSASGG
jgi:predicted enzyme related to lactoylglutathione lyase